MQIQYNCYKCIFNQIVDMAKTAFTEDTERRRLLKIFMNEVIEHSENFTPPEMAARFYTIYREETGEADPFAEEKQKSTELALKLYPELEAMVKNSADPFLTAVKLAISGNVIDFGATPDFQLKDAENAIRSTIARTVDTEALELLRSKAQQAKNILYILDNCGEAVIDRLLINELGAEKVTLGVRGKAILNDVTRAELPGSGLGDLPVIDNGFNAPGVSLRFSSPEFLERMNKADLVIAKGQGNFESLNDAQENANIFFLFRVKCPVICEITGKEYGTLQICQGRNKKRT